MIKEIKIKGRIFIEQITYYAYSSEEDLQKEQPYLVTSSKEIFESCKKIALTASGQNLKL